MGDIIKYIRNYLVWIDKRILFFSILFISSAIFCNYFFHWQSFLYQLPLSLEYAAWYFIFLTAFSFPHILTVLFSKKSNSPLWPFYFLMFVAPAVFAAKMVLPVHLTFTSDVLANIYWNKVFYWPIKLFGLATALFIIWRKFNREQPFYGFSTKHISLKPYFIMLLIMVPLIAAAATQHDFLQVYPKLMRIEPFLTGDYIGIKKLIYEVAYGIDFISIELFFRGFLVLSFAKWIGKEAVLPMALFYCTIHFGKPLGECISSFFGGIILGTITYHTRSIYGGLMVHLGIAWLMELGGYLGHSLL
ncbi:MAG: CPBP family intramembrane glutamic endopeptidase [Chitinophagaceae bacterium]